MELILCRVILRLTSETNMVIMAVMANNSVQTTTQEVMQFIIGLGPMIISIFTVWQVVDKVAKYISARQEEKLKQLIKSTISPDLEKLQKMIEALTKSHDDFTESLNKIKYGK